MARPLRSIWIWYLLSLAWLILAIILGLLTLFRAVKSSGAAGLMQFEDIPLLRFADLQYTTMLWSAAGLAAVFLAVLTAAWLELPRQGRSCRPALHTGTTRGALREAGETRWSLAAIWLPCCAGATVLCGLIGCRYSFAAGSTVPELHPAGVLGWAFVLLSAVTGWGLVRAIARTDDGIPPSSTLPKKRIPLVVRLALVFLLGTVAVCIEAVLAHWRFWDPTSNGDYNYQVFFAASEMREARLVLYSCSGLFASVAALSGCVAYVLFHRFVCSPIALPACGTAIRPARSRLQMGRSCQMERIALLMAGMWAVVLGVPWQVKLLPDIQAQRGWIMPAVVLILLPAALAPLLAVTLLMISRDFRPRRGAVACPADPPRPAELAVWNLLLFPVYPLIRWLPLGKGRWRYLFLTLLSGGMVASLLVAVVKIDDWFDFEDWRHMLRGAQFPFLKVWLSLLAACVLYLSGRRAAEWLGWCLLRIRLACVAAWRLGCLRSWRATRFGTLPMAWNWGCVLASWRAARGPSRGAQWLRGAFHATILTAAAACLAFATWPFWGWRQMPKNVLARCVEFHSRHEFELSFLHWLFDADRDGYAAVLHGGDADDFDRSVQAGGLAAPQTVALPVDRFTVGDSATPRTFSNVVVLYLEGVVPRAIGVFGQRRLPPRLSPTPAIDSVAAEGTIFTQARCYYPSTWDAWFATCSGRFLRIVEMRSTELSGDHYSPHSNLYHVLKLLRIDRWCHADTAPYCDLLVPRDLHAGGKPPWKPEKVFRSSLTAEEEERGVWRGDKRMQRILDFLDDLKPGERFFLTEHMCDTHFPWKATPLDMARELGFPDGLEPYSVDAVLPNGKRYGNYSHYYQSVTRTDAQIGKLLAKLRQRKLYDDTLILIVGDHGCQWWEHERLYYVSHLYDPSLRMPLVIRVPGQTGGTRCDEPVLQIDILPTIVELAGMRHANAGVTGPLPGRSLAPAIRGKGKVPAEVAATYRYRDVPLLTHYDMLGVIHDFRYKLIFHRPSGTYLLFDLQEDPGEMTNLADARPELLEEMMRRLRTLFAEHKALTGKLREKEPVRDEECPADEPGK